MNHLPASLKKFTTLVLLSPLHCPLPNSVSSQCPGCPRPNFMHCAACVPTPQPLVDLVQPPRVFRAPWKDLTQCLAMLLVTGDPSAPPSYPPAYTPGSGTPMFNVHRHKASLSQTSPLVIAKRNTYAMCSVSQDPDTDLSPSSGQRLTSSCSLPWSSSQQASGEAGRPRGGCPLL